MLVPVGDMSKFFIGYFVLGLHDKTNGMTSACIECILPLGQTLQGSELLVVIRSPLGSGAIFLLLPPLPFEDMLSVEQCT